MAAGFWGVKPRISGRPASARIGCGQLETSSRLATFPRGLRLFSSFVYFAILSGQRVTPILVLQRHPVVVMVALVVVMVQVVHCWSGYCLAAADAGADTDPSDRDDGNDGDDSSERICVVAGLYSF